MLGTTSPPDIYFSWSDEFAFKFIRGNKALDLSSYYKMTPIGHHSSFNRKLHHLLMKTSNMAYRGKWTLNHSSIIKTFSKS